MAKMFLVLLLPVMLVAQAPTREAFAELLKIPMEPPAVEVTSDGVRVEEGLRIEDLSWRSRDGQRVPARVIRPAEATGRLPAVVCLHGSGGGRDSLTTKKFGPGSWTTPGREQPHRRMLGWCRELARRGYLTLAMTQRGLDDREPFINTESNILLVQGKTGMGVTLDEIRQGVTYLQSRPDVAPDRIAPTGMSFGGITAFYLWLLDDRVAAAAPICGGVGSIRAFIERGGLGYHGTYWWVPNMLLTGDQADFAAPLAPRPLMLWAPTEDVGMPREGVEDLLKRLRPAYAKAGRPEALVAHRPQGGHEFSPAAFKALVEFFDEFL